MLKKYLPALLLSLLLPAIALAETAAEAPVTPKSPARIENKAKETPAAPDAQKGHAVIFEGKELLRIHSDLGPLTPGQRAETVAERLKKIKEAGSFDSDRLQAVASEFTTDIIYDTSIIMSITDIDAKEEQKEAAELAELYLGRIKHALKTLPAHTIVNQPSDLYDLFMKYKELIIKAASALAAFVALLFILYLLSKIINRLYAAVESGKGTRFRSITIKGSEIVSDETVVSTLILAIRGVRLTVTIGLLYLFITIVFVLFPWAKSPSIKGLIKGVLLTVLAAAIGFGIYKTLKMVMTLLENNISKWKGTIIRPLRVKTVDILTEDQIVQILKKTVMLVRISFNLLILYLFIPIVLSFFEFTSTWADTLFGYILAPLKSILSSFIGFIPNLFFIAVIIFVNRYVIKLTWLFFFNIGRGDIVLTGFHREWAEPTYKIARTFIIIFTIIVAFPYIPGSQSDAFKGVSIFLGILFSLGSTSVVANVVAGTVLTYMYAFKLGDRVKIGDTTGDVVEKTLLITRIRTIKNIIITIPNSLVMGSHIINYSTSAAREGIILHTTVTLGYDAPWRKVHDTLKAAALMVESVKKEPPPFVLQTGLDDFYVSYELNCYTDKPEAMSLIYSELHQNIQDKCNEAGIEILSPHYAAARDGSATAIPGDYLPATYEAPPFVVKIVEKLSGGGKGKP